MSGRAGGMVVAALAALAIPAGSFAQGVDTSCQFSFTRLDSTTTNILLVDTNAVYWGSAYQAIPGTRIRITGEFPHSRYTSWNVYDSAARVADAISDVRIKPDKDSSNPFLPGADRTKVPRKYTLFLRLEQKPDHPEPNTLYAGPGNLQGSFLLRIYVPDKGRDAKGGVPLPKITLEPDGAGGATPSAGFCRSAQAPYLQSLNDVIAASGGAPDFTGESTAYPGRNPPVWRKFVNFSIGFTEVVLNNETGEDFYGPAQELPINDPKRGAGIFANNDIAYVFTGTSQGFGKVLTIHGRAPTFADTRPGPRLMPKGKQLRYFSFCQYEPASQRVIDCRSDDRIAVDSKGFYTVVVSTPENKPSNARSSCGVTWLPWGPFKQGLLIYRHMLADRSFKQAVQRVPEPGLEKKTMGTFYPDAHYLDDKAAFERRGCASAASEPGGDEEKGGSQGGSKKRSGGGASAGAGGTAGSGTGSGSLPFTGLALFPLLALGAALTAAGLALRRNAGRRPG
jgi:hypothetical protein